MAALGFGARSASRALCWRRFQAVRPTSATKNVAARVVGRRNLQDDRRGRGGDLADVLGAAGGSSCGRSRRQTAAVSIS